MRDWIRRHLPTQERLRSSPALRWLAPLLARPSLWHLTRRRVALGAGIGVFCGLITPLAQIFGATLLAVLLRANLPVAALATLVTNPVTFGPIFVLAYRTGSALVGEPVRPGTVADLERTVATPRAPEPERPDESGWIRRARTVGKPLFVGLAVFAVAGGIAAWALVHLAWIARVRIKRRRRLRGRRRT